MIHFTVWEKAELQLLLERVKNASNNITRGKQLSLVTIALSNVQEHLVAWEQKEPDLTQYAKTVKSYSDQYLTRYRNIVVENATVKVATIEGLHQRVMSWYTIKNIPLDVVIRYLNIASLCKSTLSENLNHTKQSTISITTKQTTALKIYSLEVVDMAKALALSVQTAVRTISFSPKYKLIEVRL